MPVLSTILAADRTRPTAAVGQVWDNGTFLVILLGSPSGDNIFPHRINETDGNLDLRTEPLNITLSPNETIPQGWTFRGDVTVDIRLA